MFINKTNFCYYRDHVSAISNVLHLNLAQAWNPPIELIQSRISIRQFSIKFWEAVILRVESPNCS
jgi:hypothetical protein